MNQEIEKLASELSGEFHNAGSYDTSTVGIYWKYEHKWIALAKHVLKLQIEARIDEVNKACGREFQFETDKRITELEAQLMSLE